MDMFTPPKNLKLEVTLPTYNPENKPWEDTEIWDKSKPKYATWVRGKLRQIWQDWPLKNEFKDAACRPITDVDRAVKKFHPSTKFVGDCAFCNEPFPKSNMEVDHTFQAGSLDVSNIQPFWDHLLCNKANMQITCKPCHKIKSHSENRGLTFEQAAADKKAIEACKMPVSDQKLQLSVMGLPNANAKERRASWYQHFLEAQ